MDEPIAGGRIVIERLSFTYANGVEALRDFSLTVGAGEFVAVVGQSGCGKSTLLRCIAGLLPSGGSVSIDDERVNAPSSRVGIMFQEPALLPWRTVEENVRLPLELANGRARERGRTGERESEIEIHQFPSPSVHGAPNPHSLISLVGLDGFAGARPRELSGGMAQRTALARALALRPPVLLLDEPFGALDALTRESLTVSLQAIWREARATCVLVTHNIAEAVFLADRVAVCSPRPGRVTALVEVALPRPRTWEMESSATFGEAMQAVRAALTAG